MFKSAMRMIVPCLGVVLLAGCTKYYRVTNPSNGQVYYTTRMEQRSEGAVMFTDARTESNITIQNSEVKEITEAQYEEGLRQEAAKAVKPTTMPATK